MRVWLSFTLIISHVNTSREALEIIITCVQIEMISCTILYISKLCILRSESIDLSIGGDGASRRTFVYGVGATRSRNKARVHNLHYDHDALSTCTTTPI
jgi:hypothetical protein